MLFDINGVFPKKIFIFQFYACLSMFESFPGMLALRPNEFQAYVNVHVTSGRPMVAKWWRVSDRDFFVWQNFLFKMTCYTCLTKWVIRYIWTPGKWCLNMKHKQTWNKSRKFGTGSLSQPIRNRDLSTNEWT